MIEWTTEIVSAVSIFREQKFTWKEVAKKIGVNQTTLRRWRKRVKYISKSLQSGRKSIGKEFLVSQISGNTSIKKQSSGRTLRAYEPIWIEVRKQHKCVIEVSDRRFLRRIKLMIIKEKCMDNAFQILNTVERLELKFTWDDMKSELTISLISKFGIAPIEG